MDVEIMQFQQSNKFNCEPHSPIGCVDVANSLCFIWMIRVLVSMIMNPTSHQFDRSNRANQHGVGRDCDSTQRSVLKISNLAHLQSRVQSDLESEESNIARWRRMKESSLRSVLFDIMGNGYVTVIFICNQRRGALGVLGSRHSLLLHDL